MTFRSLLCTNKLAKYEQNNFNIRINPICSPDFRTATKAANGTV